MHKRFAGVDHSLGLALVLSLLSPASWAAMSLTNNPLGIASFAPNPFGATIPTTDPSFSFEGSNQGTFDRDLNNGSRTRIVSATASTGSFRFSTATPFTVGTALFVDYCFNGWGGTYTYDAYLNGVAIATNQLGVYDLKHITPPAAFPMARGGITNLTVSFTDLQDDRSGTLFEIWLLPLALRRIALTGASVTAYGATTYGSAGELFDYSLGNEFLVRNYDGGGRRGLEIDLGGTKAVKAFLFLCSWRSTSTDFRYYDGSWHSVVGFRSTGDDGDVVLLSTPVTATKVGFEYGWDYADGWAGPREIMLFEEAPSPIPAGTTVQVK